ncbi:hypothetical protein PanWU01x14_117570 [Parasponia andersonii]|uniref:Uncharacterized protein n=1 Tax=Parasponia andersonii TaxID=3476 RepID=A0A2P5CWM5_PARAD|nr:hypothetical protein PanWU01x14_117570 [Parasponia andersonii]
MAQNQMEERGNQGGFVGAFKSTTNSQHQLALEHLLRLRPLEGARDRDGLGNEGSLVCRGVPSGGGCCGLVELSFLFYKGGNERERSEEKVAG